MAPFSFDQTVVPPFAFANRDNGGLLPVVKANGQWIPATATGTGRGSGVGVDEYWITATYTTTLSTSGILTTVESNGSGLNWTAESSTETIDLNTGTYSFSRSAALYVDAGCGRYNKTIADAVTGHVTVTCTTTSYPYTVVPCGGGGLSAPTNLKATQIGNSGTQIQLTWDYGSDPIDGFKLERQTPQERITNTWQSISATPSVGTPGHWYAIDTTASAFATYNYRVRAYQGTTNSDNSNEAACFQLQLQTIRNNLQMLATFQPDAVSLSAAAGAFGFTHFNWISFLTYAKNDPTCVLGIGPGCLKAANGAVFPFPPPPLIDPPYPGGWSYLPADALPYYWNEQAGFDPTYFLTAHKTPTLAPTTLDFNDLPVVPWWVPSDHYEYSTHLVGITVPFGSAPPQYKTLASFTWSTNFTGASGGIMEYRISNLVPPDNPGSGSIFNIQLVTPKELPASIRSALTSSGAVGISTAPKIDKDAPTTAAFLSGPQGTNGWYTGPATVTLIATDIDGPTDIASTTYSLDGGSTTGYFTPFTVSGDGVHSVQFGSVDRTGNVESPRPSQSFKIDATRPTVSCTANPATLWPPNGKPVAVTVTGTITDATSGVDLSSTTYAVTDEYGQVQPSGSVTLRAGGSYSFGVSLIADRDGSDKDGRTYTIVVRGKDKAGNAGSCSAIVTVPHDQGA